jgi:hypothetical protein
MANSIYSEGIHIFSEGIHIFSEVNNTKDDAG